MREDSHGCEGERAEDTHGCLRNDQTNVELGEPAASRPADQQIQQIPWLAMRMVFAQNLETATYIPLILE